MSWTPPAPVWPVHQGACSGSIATTTTPTRTYLHAVTATGLENDSTAGREVVYRRSANLGATWPAAVQLTSNHEFESCPRIAASGSTVVVIWQASTVTGHSSIKLRVSTDHGLTWGPIRRVPAPLAPGSPSVAVAGSSIFVAWTDGVAQPAWSRISTSHDHGATWTLRRLDAKPALSETLVAASGSTVVTAWLRSPDASVVTRLSLDGAVSWRYPVVAGPVDPQVSPYARVIALAAHGDRVAVAWTTGKRYTNPELAVRIATNAIWAPTVMVTATSPDPARGYGFFNAPAIALLSSTRVGVAFAACYRYEMDGSCGEGLGGTIDDALWAESADNGATWTTPVIVSSVDTVAGRLNWSNVNRISVAWPSRDLRAVLVWRMSGETEWFSRNFFTRGYGLP